MERANYGYLHPCRNVGEVFARAYLIQVWAESMEIYRSSNFKLQFNSIMNEYLKVHQRDLMLEDTRVGQIIGYLELCPDSIVYPKQIFQEAEFDELNQWKIREINDIINNRVTLGRAFSNPRYFRSHYGRQKGWERIQPNNGGEDFRELTQEEAEQLEFPKGLGK